jgi:hypothetical protein
MNNSLRVTKIIGARTWSNTIWASILCIGSLGFINTGLNSYSGESGFSFIPQGLIMCFYGLAGLFMGGYLAWTIFFNVGAGYNEFDWQRGTLTVFRWGFPGQNRKLRLRCLLSDIEGIVVTNKTSIGGNTGISVQLQGQVTLPLASGIRPWMATDLEREAAQLAQMLQVPLDSEL